MYRREGVTEISDTAHIAGDLQLLFANNGVYNANVLVHLMQFDKLESLLWNLLQGKAY